MEGFSDQKTYQPLGLHQLNDIFSVALQPGETSTSLNAASPLVVTFRHFTSH
jgi:hypothetical protein